MAGSAIATLVILLLCGCAHADITDVHVVTMNHLDIGFANFAYAIINEYFDTYFPNAAVLGQQLVDRNGTERLIYTSHCWLLDVYLNCDKYTAMKTLPPGDIHCPNATALANVTAAIQKGYISWHGMPFNGEMEFAMLPEYLGAVLGICQSLDDRFGFAHKRTVSQRDVPGTTRSIIPVFNQNGIQALSVGVNEATSPPAVPKIFLWKDPVSSQDIVAMWHPGGYGGYSLTDCVTFGNFTHALCWDFRGDNAGPPAMPEVLQTFKDLAKEFPGAKIFASTYDQFLDAVLPVKSQLPVYDQEIGDTWIHGIQTDPAKTSFFREIVRARTECVSAGKCDPKNDFNFHTFDVLLSKMIEHTWGLDVKTWLHDTTNWSNQQFNAAKSASNYEDMLRSWIEQRQYLTVAVVALGNSSFAKELLQRMDALYNARVNLQGFTEGDINKVYDCGQIQIGFDPITGAINQLVDKTNKYSWFSKGEAASFVYRTYSQDDYTYFKDNYINEFPVPSWADLDFGKPGMPGVSATVNTTVQKLYVAQNSTTYQFYVQMALPADSVALYGAPAFVWLYISVPVNSASFSLNVFLSNKTSTRFAESLHLVFRPYWPSGSSLTYDKLGEWIAYDDVILNGSKHLHSITTGFKFLSGARTLYVASWDAALLNVGIPDIRPVPLNANPDPSQGVSFVLSDNFWGTNYPMWYPFLDGDDNLFFRFEVSLS